MNHTYPQLSASDHTILWKSRGCKKNRAPPILRYCGVEKGVKGSEETLSASNWVPKKVETIRGDGGAIHHAPLGAR